jgi:hypothetical protein
MHLSAMSRPDRRYDIAERISALMNVHAKGADSITSNLLAVLAAFVSIISTYMIRVADPDLWGHLRYGQLFLESGRIAIPDPFAYTTAGLAWHTHEYLSQIVLWLTYDTAGPLGLIALKCLAGGATLFLLYRCIRLASGDARIWSPTLILAASLLGRFYLFRPQLVTFLWLSAFVWLVWRHLLDRRAFLWLLPPLLALWANMHGGFVAGIGVLGLGLGLKAVQSWRIHGFRAGPLWRDARPLTATLLASLAASLLTPMGWKLWPFLIIELGNPFNRKYIIEWQPVRLDAPGLDGVLMIVMVVLLTASWAWAQRRVSQIAGLRPWHWALSCLPLVFMAFQSHRHIPIMVIWCAPVLALLAQSAMSARPESRPARLTLALVTALILVPALLGAYYTLSNPAPQIQITDDSLGKVRPFRAVEFLRANDLSGNVYAPLWWGAYITWELYPDVLVAMDGRNDTLYPVSMVGENLEFYKDMPATLDAPLRYPTDFLLAPANVPVLPMLEADPRWVAIFKDHDATLFVRADAAHAEVVRRSAAGELQTPVTSAPRTFNGK